MNPNYDDIVYFLEVAQTQNISRAAERLGVTQPSLSISMKRLETAVGVSLLHRSKTGVHLTPVGRKFVFQARTFLEEWKSLKSKALASENEVDGHLTLGCHASVASFTLPLCLSKIFRDHPKLEISLVHDWSRIITEKVISHQVDLGIVINPVQHPDLVIQNLGSDEVRFWQADGLDVPPVIICDAGMSQAQSMLRRAKSFSEGKKILNSNQLELIARLTASGAGTGILPTRVALLSKQKLVPVRSLPTYIDKIALIYRIENRGLKSIKTLSQHISSVFE